MFRRSNTRQERNSKDSSQNIQINELFNYIQERDTEKIIEYFQNPDYKIWQIKDESGYTILHKAAFNCDIEMTELIIKETKRRLGMGKGNALEKFINEKTNEGLTALHYAANKGSIPLLKLLIENGANVDVVTKLGKNLMHLAAEGNQPSMLIYLLTEEHQSAQSVDENGSTPLHWACYFGAEEAVDFLLNLKVDINEQDKEKLTPLHLATNEGRENIVIKLLQKNADKNLANNKGELPIDIARKKNYKKIEEILSEEDFNPLCSIQMPKYYIEPKDIYKKFIILMIIIPEIVNYLFVLPYLEDYIGSFISVISFFLCLLFFFIFIAKDPGYRKNSKMEKDANGKYPLILKIKEGIDVKNYCPKCFIQKAINIKHCFICDKCVEEFSHHCFWMNKCIGKGNKTLYIIFIFFALFYANHSLYICLELLWDDVNLPYDSKFLHLYLFDRKKGFRVLFAIACGIFSLIVGTPLWFLFLNEMFKLCFKKKTIASQLQELALSSSGKNMEKIMGESMIELKEEKKDLLINDEEEVDEKGLLLREEENQNENIGSINDSEVKEKNNEEKIKEIKEIKVIENKEEEEK